VSTFFWAMIGLTEDAPPPGGDDEIVLTNRTLGAISSYPNECVCQLLLTNGGVLATNVSTGTGGPGMLIYTPISGQWQSPHGWADGSLYEVRFSKTGGTETPANLGTWLSLGTDRDWLIQIDGGGFFSQSKTLTGTLEIRLAATSEVVATATINMTADYLGLE
jgi:hypothetical protein